jgi:hypothetical protein
MKNKIFIGIAMSLFTIATVVNMDLVQSNDANDISLENITVMAQAQSEQTPQQPNVADCVYDPDYSCIALHPTDPSKDVTRENAKWN